MWNSESKECRWISKTVDGSLIEVERKWVGECSLLDDRLLSIQ